MKHFAVAMALGCWACGPVGAQVDGGSAGGEPGGGTAGGATAGGTAGGATAGGTAGGATAGGTAGGATAGGTAGGVAGGTAGGVAGGSDGGVLGCAPRPFANEVASVSSTTLPTDFGVQGPLTVVVDSTVASPRWPMQPVSVYRPMGTTPYPVLFYSHAFGGVDHTFVAPMLRRLASHGYNVVFVPYRPTDSRVEQYATLWEGFRSAVGVYGAQFDLTRVGFFGHSFGGGATPEMARRAFAAPTQHGLTSAWGTNGRFVFIMAPWFSWVNVETPTVTNDHYRDLPNDVKVVIQVYGDDDVNDHRIAETDIWNKLPATLSEKVWMVVHSDVCDGQVLAAGHGVPAGHGGMGDSGNNDNGLDVWAVSRHVHAMAEYALRQVNSARDVALLTTPASRSMGNWVSCGGRAVRPIDASATAPVFSPCAGLGGMNPPSFAFGDDRTTRCRFSTTGTMGSPPCR